MFIKDGKKYPTVTDSGIYGFFQAYRYLSNFHKCVILLDGIAYPSSEHAYMSCKTLDPDEKRWFQSGEPWEAKRLGQRVFLRSGWDTRLRVPEMERVLEAKFAQNTDIREKLLATEDKYLEETNDWGDTFWGVVNGHGKNELGKALMRVRRRMQLLGPWG
jgi:ribA/ribD-fused uncharacterized protein